jgi:predicted enzyme related to lactoylglutathione lyase
MLRGLATVSFWADDVAEAERWYADVLGVEAYFRRPGYVEFRLGDRDDELGIIDRRWAPAGTGPVTGGTIVYWHVDDLPAAVDRLLEHGASVHAPVTERGAGFVTASVADPFGNVLGIMSNPNWVAHAVRP